MNSITTNRKRIFRRVAVAAVALAAVICLTGCKPTLQLNQKYAYTKFDVQYGTPVSTDVGEYFDLSGRSKEDIAFIKANVKIEYNGIKEPGKSYDKPGVYSLVIRYCGRQYRHYTVTVKDSTPPVFTKAQDLYTFAGLDEEMDFKSMFAATDASSGMKLSIDSSKVNIHDAGDYKVTATARDSSGNTATKSATVHVQSPSYGAKGTYIYIDISSQTLTYFIDGQVDMSCPVVTGNVSQGHGTPTGVYRINNKSTDTRLKGEGYDVKVAYWMSFIGGYIGMHSAQWRSSFGGSQYLTDGSHGCVNMPTSAAAYIFNNAPTGTPVIVVS